ncbi:hypothetical protein GUJ93_ZPchr0011g26979 [Zizania palustris]|uniref:DUF629 domain-containing protein n=1 Tax=Zizania palustris TaxID=103762 RepID=A0A8J6BR42_ZIZPA|nr:hypothetical protein GUJ93_ZPchr0011g26979 [Zizania palustris]
MARVCEPSNRDWLDCDDGFREEADRAILEMLEDEEKGYVKYATALVDKYPVSPLAHCIVARGCALGGKGVLAIFHFMRAAELAPRCPIIPSMLADLLIKMGLWDKAVEVCDRFLRVPEDHTDPAWHWPFLSNKVANYINSTVLQYRIAFVREQIRGRRVKADKGKGAAVPLPPERAFAPKWPPETIDLSHAGARWSCMNDEERHDFLNVSFGEMKSYCRRPGVLPEQCVQWMMSMLSDAEVFVKEGCSSYWICPLCIHVCTDATIFMWHIENQHIEGDSELLSSLPTRIPDSEKELLKSWRWVAIDGDDLAERTEILSMIKSIAFELIDMDAISVNLLNIMHKFVMNRVRPVTPSIVSMCASCGIGQLSYAHLKELYKFLEPLTHTPTDYEHQKGPNVEQESQQDSLVITWSKETRTLSIDCGKITSIKTDDSSKADGLFACLFGESLLEDPMESWVGMWQKCIDHGPGILNKISVVLDKLNRKYYSWKKLTEIQLGVHSLPQAIFSSEIDIQLYFDYGIGFVQIEMLLIDAEVNYLKKRLLKNCEVDYLAIILPIAKACLWAKLNNNPPEDALLACPPDVYELQVPLKMILRKECKQCDPNKFRFMASALRSDLIDEKPGKITASRFVKLIFERLHKLQTPLHFEFKGEALEPQTKTMPNCLGCICLTHDLFGLHITEEKCNCVNNVSAETEYTTFFHSIDLGTVERTKLESFSELLKAVNKQLLCDPRNGGCGHNIARYLSYPPHLFMTVFSWPDNKGSHINMHEVLISLAAGLDINHVYKYLHSDSKYTLVSAVCCDDEGRYLCFAQDKNKWLIYDGKTIEAIPVCWILARISPPVQSGQPPS